MDATWYDATVELATWLTSQLDVPVRWVVPNPRPDQFVVVRRSGSGVPIDWADWANMTVECWSGSPNDPPKPAHLLAVDVRAALLAAPSGDNHIARVRITGQAFLPDADTFVPRVIVGAQILIRATNP